MLQATPPGMCSRRLPKDGANVRTDAFTEPQLDPATLHNLGPLAPVAGVWEGEGVDVHPVASGSTSEPYVERYELDPKDPQTNGPQPFYELRYQTKDHQEVGCAVPQGILSGLPTALPASRAGFMGCVLRVELLERSPSLQ